MSDVLYIQTEKNVEVYNPQVCLGDVAELACADKGVLNRNRVRKVFTIPDGAPGRYVLSALDLVRAVEEAEEHVDVNHIGEANVIVTYETKKHKYVFFSWVKTIFVCLVTFFGAAFSIMTFNTDVDIPGLFFKLYSQFTGKASDGRTVLELAYSVGIGIGVIFFFNHFGHKKLTQDPTPMEVQMRVYEDEVDKTLAAEKSRADREKGAGR